MSGTKPKLSSVNKAGRITDSAQSCISSLGALARHRHQLANATLFHKNKIGARLNRFMADFLFLLVWALAELI